VIVYVILCDLSLFIAQAGPLAHDSQDAHVRLSSDLAHIIRPVQGVVTEA
jgi:hypothetical protein